MRARLSNLALPAHVDQPFARTLLGLRNRLGETGDLRIDVLLGDGRQAVLVDRLVKALDLAGNDRHLVDDRALHLLRIGLLLVALAHVFTDVEDGHVVLGLELRNGALHIDHILQLLLDGRHDAARIDLHRVDLRLVEKQFLGHKGFERLVHRVAVGGITLGTALGDELVGIFRHFGIEDRRGAHDGHHLVEHHLLFLREHPCSEQGESRPQHTFSQHFVIVYRLYSLSYCLKSSLPRFPSHG